MKYHEHGQGGDYVNDVTKYVCYSIDEMRELIEDIYSQDHYDECEFCEKNNNDMKLCTKNFTKQLIKNKYVDYGNYRGECSMNYKIIFIQ